MIVLAILTGVLTGILSGLLGIGGGAIFVVAAVFFLGVPQHAAQAAAIAAMIPTAIVGVVKHHRNRLIDYRYLPYLAAGIILGGMVGAYVANITADIVLRRLFSAFFALMSIQMFWSSFRQGRKAPAKQQDHDKH
ncbi:TSUP family transporter [Anaeroselena agilis]|uniref:Probable membrane transporter protein n=1 Tax=Anaeroselena agilis TaxID=3063788 RepID=A0ABU3P0B8_9FIRM|nr:sulfite exporter TauE/SafE family protein [Selenomonadales bacterium 4137-cl]